MNPFAPRVLASLLATLCLAAAAAPLQIRSLTMKPPANAKDLGPFAAGWAEGSIKMPFVEAEGAVAARINDALFLTVLNIAAPVKPGASFTPPADQLPEGTTTQDFQASRNDERVLTLSFSAEGCGAYCEEYDVDYNFDARSGRLLALEDLVRPAAYATLARRLNQEGRRLYTQQIKTLRRQLAAAQKKRPPATDEIEDLEQRIELNEGCLGEGGEGRWRADSLGYVGLSLAKPGITLRAGRCSNHASRALDDVGDIVLTLPPSELQPLLTDYGRALILQQGDAAPPASPFGQVLHGRIGSAPITLLLDRANTDGSVSGHYFYDRYRQLIHLGGKREGNRLVLSESVNDKNATLTLQLRGMSLTGQWQGGGKTLPVTLDW
jgi:hypothetical protein